MLEHDSHLQDLTQPTPLLKHSQYFLEHYDFLQLQPLCYFITSNLTRKLSKAKGFLSIMLCLANFLSFSSSSVFLQPTHPHSASQYLPLRKHSQYSFKHYVFLQLHLLCPSSICCSFPFLLFILSSVFFLFTSMFIINSSKLE